LAHVLKPSPTPELIIGLVAPIGVDLDTVVDILTELLREMSYRTSLFRVTSLMREVPTGLSISSDSYVLSYKSRIAYANAICARLGEDALAAMAISAIQAARPDIWKSQYERGLSQLPPEALAEETPVPSQAYIIRQLKRPEEVRLLRSVYGRQFILVSAYSPQEVRLKRIEDLERSSQGGLVSEVDAHKSAFELVAQDAREIQEPSGQNVRDAFPLGDVFIDASTKISCRETLRRFIHLLFGSNEITPTHDEYGMYLAKSASLRSSDLSRQVGAAIFRQSGEVASLGCNEVPKAGGGTYWPGDEGDKRDFVQGHDPNEVLKMSLVVDVLDRLVKGSHLSEELLGIGDAQKICKKLLQETGNKSIRESKVMDLVEFGRIIHAEMLAITDAARKGIPLQDATLYCTTFPCHLCAKHVVACGVKRLVYLEPYPKSYAEDLHGDSIEVEGEGRSGKVSFEPFKGVSPQRYRDLFEKGKRKMSSGAALPWDEGHRHPMIEVYYPSYFQAEVYVAARLREGMDDEPQQP
jgi:deoxycytidylate deaminase